MQQPRAFAAPEGFYLTRTEGRHRVAAAVVQRTVVRNANKIYYYDDFYAFTVRRFFFFFMYEENKIKIKRTGEWPDGPLNAILYSLRCLQPKLKLGPSPPASSHIALMKRPIYVQL